jgi:uncharacterized protein
MSALPGRAASQRCWGFRSSSASLSCRRQYANGKTIDNAFQTNGTLLDDAWGEFLARNKFLIGLSSMGRRDSRRVPRGQRRPANLRPRDARPGILKKHGVEFNTLTVINRLNSYRAHEVYRFLKEIGSKYLQFIPIVEQVAKEPDPNGLVLLKPYSRQETPSPSGRSSRCSSARFSAAGLRRVGDSAMWAASLCRSSTLRLESWAGAAEPLRLLRPPAAGAGCGAQRRRLLLRPLCLSRQQAGQHHAEAIVWPGELTAADALWQCEGDRASLRLPEVRCALCLQRRVPQASLHARRIGRVRPELSLRGYKHFFHHIDPYMRFMAE